MANDTGSSPYRQAWRTYRAAGWEGVLPLPPGLKHPPPAGWTGWGGPMPSHADGQAWADGPEGGGNIALRAPRGVLGIDADTYKPAGAQTMRELEARLGPLPATWISSARTDGSGIRWYRVPADIPGWHSKAGEGVELVHFGHRYAVVWPSTNPHAGDAIYDWLTQPADSDEYMSTNGTFPRPSDLPELPHAWIEALRAPAPGAKAHLAEGESLRWLEAVRDGAPCPPVAGVLARAIDAFGTQASRYDTMRDSMRALTGFGAEGHAGSIDALAALRHAYLTATAGERRDTVGEWARALEGAIALEIERRPGGPDSFCACAGAPGFFLPSPAEDEPGDGWDLAAETAKVVDQLDHHERMAAAFALARALGARPAEEKAAVWAEFKRIGLALGDLAEAYRAARKEHRERERAAEAIAEAAARQERVRAAREEGAVLPAPNDPMAVAREVVGRYTGERLRRWRGDFYAHTGTHWARQPEDEVRDLIYTWTEHAQYVAEEGELLPWRPAPAKVTGVLEALSAVVRRPAALEDDRVVACRNGVLDVATRQLHPHEPQRFNLTSLPYNYDPEATAPQWLEFLEASLPGDVQAHQFLQEWTGYLISGDTSQQKVACLVGARRAGKGTINRIVQAVLGAENVVGATLSSIAGSFGLEPMIGKSLVTMPDVSWKVRDAAESAEMIKMISGEDMPPVNRKNKQAYPGRLWARFMLMTNNTPTFEDASGALAGRLICVNFQQSFFGREDTTLTSRLMEELPGILNWALEGLARLHERGRFVEPHSSAQVRDEMQRASAKLHGFLTDDVVRSEAAAPVELDDLYDAYKAWCEDEQRDHVVARANFTRELNDEGVRTRRDTTARKVPVPGRPLRPTWVYGVAPRAERWRKPKSGTWVVSGKPGYLT